MDHYHQQVHQGFLGKEVKKKGKKKGLHKDTETSKPKKASKVMVLISTYNDATIFLMLLLSPVANSLNLTAQNQDHVQIVINFFSFILLKLYFLCEI